MRPDRFVNRGIFGNCTRLNRFQIDRSRENVTVVHLWCPECHLGLLLRPSASHAVQSGLLQPRGFAPVMSMPLMETGISVSHMSDTSDRT